jgi:hypothetical protein
MVAGQPEPDPHKKKKKAHQRKTDGENWAVLINIKTSLFACAVHRWEE